VRALIIIPVPLLLLVGIVLSGIGSKRESKFYIPYGIETASVEDQVDFGDRARKSDRYQLALQYCIKGTESEDLLTQLQALTCMAWAHKATGDIDESIRYMNEYKSVEESQGWDTQSTDKEIAELEKMR
jgi:hypothetical protein